MGEKLTRISEEEDNRLLDRFQDYDSEVCGRLGYVFVTWEKTQEEFHW